MGKKALWSFWASALLLLAACASSGNQRQVDRLRAEGREVIVKVNTHWQKTVPAQEWSFWDVASYHTGNMAAYEVTGDPAYRRYSEQWAEHNQWKGAKSDVRKDWKLTYGETDDHVLFGDWQICFQTYLDLNALAPDPRKIARVREVMDYQISTPRNDYWWWADGLYMVMPAMTKLYQQTGDRRYLDKLAEYFDFADRLMFDADAGLYYRDGRYVYPKHKTPSGKKDFWSRGDGWVFAGLAKVLSDLPATDPLRARFEQKFIVMAQALKAAQQSEGYWTRSLLDPAFAPGPESSGTAFFTYGFVWGINHGLLDRAEYLPTALKGWDFLTKVAIQPDGKVGYVQPIGDRAIPGQVVDRHSTAHFGVGAVLLAAAEFSKLKEQ